MAELDYKPNSNRYKKAQKNVPAEKKKVEKVVTGNVKTRRKSGVSKLKDTFISEDISMIPQLDISVLTSSTALKYASS